VSEPAASPPQRLTLTHWLILTIAAIGFAFDTYELLMLPLIIRPALPELISYQPGSAEFTDTVTLYRGLMFWVPAMAGGVFGLFGGYLTDLLGRRRVLTWSILLYAVSAFLAGFATSLPMLLVLRSTTFIGVCVEFVAAVAWLAELFPNPAQRERVLGYTQAFASIGGLLVGGAFLLANSVADSLPPISMPDFLVPMLGEIAFPHAAWRYTLMSGLIPALPLLIIRPFLPESPIWAQRRQAGTLRRPSLGELFSPALARTTVVATLMVACSYGAAFGAIQQMPQIVPAVPEAREAFQVAVAADEAKLSKLTPPQRKGAERKIAQQTYDPIAGRLSLAQEVGGLVGRFLLALLVVRIASRRNLIRVFQVPGLVIVPLVFAFVAIHNQSLVTVGNFTVTLLHVGVFLAGLVTVAQFSFWGNYLPVAYPVHLRGTGESFAHNIGGRMIGTSFAAITSWCAGLAPGDTDAIRLANTAAAVGFAVFFFGFVLSFMLPQTREEMLRE
jgi:MFS family permease